MSFLEHFDITAHPNKQACMHARLTASVENASLRGSPAKAPPPSIIRAPPMASMRPKPLEAIRSNPPAKSLWYDFNRMKPVEISRVKHLSSEISSRGVCTGNFIFLWAFPPLHAETNCHHSAPPLAVSFIPTRSPSPPQGQSMKIFSLAP